MDRKMFVHGTEFGVPHGIYFGGDRSMTILLLEIAKESQVVIFDIEQVKVFWNLIRQDKFLPSIDYRLPFQCTWIQFSENIRLDESESDLGNSAMLLFQEGDFNRVVLINEEDDPQVISWIAGTQGNAYVLHKWTESLKDKYRLLAAACIQYINCENIYLEKQGEVPESVNRKRLRKGKSVLEPYYVCRIRGVNYDSSPTGDGGKHSIRYDVRGHFRRLDTGKTIWVRPHQRGVQNELYIPKVYKVDKGVKQSET